MKLGIALLGACGDDRDLEAITTLAHHDEFTGYCVVAIQRLVADPVDAMWKIARATDGWGKIETVERLAPMVEERADIQRWLLVEGCVNSVMNEYLACTCARAGRLDGALAGEVDEALLDGACTIITALCTKDGPAEDLADYAGGRTATRLLLGHLRTRCTTVERLGAVLAMKRHLEAALPDAQSLAICREILADSGWPERLRIAMESGDSMQSWIAWLVAPELGLDLWEPAFAQLRRGPLDDSRVYRLMRVPDHDRQRRVIAWAEASLPLTRVATGPDLHRFPIADTRVAHHCLTCVVQELRSPELYSETLVAAALRSPVISARHLALTALEARPQSGWGAVVTQSLTLAVDDEPDDQLRARVRDLLATP